MMNVWSYDSSPSDSTIRTYVKKLRKIFGENFITTVWSVGYIFMDKVEA
jgi:DNA-binding response OmpR family regulator